jgi:hypothetical protein
MVKVSWWVESAIEEVSGMSGMSQWDQSQALDDRGEMSNCGTWVSWVYSARRQTSVISQDRFLSRCVSLQVKWYTDTLMHDPSGFSPKNLGQHDKQPVKRNTCRDSRERPWPPWELPWIQRYTARRPGCEAKWWASSHLHGPSLQQLPDQKSDKQKNPAFHQNSYQYQHHSVLFAKVILNHSPFLYVFEGAHLFLAILSASFI